jgi:hypothetical protein
MYSKTLGDEQLEDVERFFKIGEISSASWRDIVEELDLLPYQDEERCDDFQRIEGLYRYLRELTPPITDLRQVRWCHGGRTICAS